MPKAATAAKKTSSKRSGNPATRAQANAKVSSAADFKKLKKGVSLGLPSGLVVRARRVSLRAYLATGNVPNPLLEIVQEALEKGQEADLSAMTSTDGGVDLEQVNSMFEMVEQIVIEMVVEPKILALPEVFDEDEEEVELDDPRYYDLLENAKDDEMVYIDDIDDEDKMFLFQWAVGGTDDLATFREESRASLDALADSQRAGHQR